VRCVPRRASPHGGFRELSSIAATLRLRRSLGPALRRDSITPFAPSACCVSAMLDARCSVRCVTLLLRPRTCYKRLCYNGQLRRETGNWDGWRGAARHSLAPHRVRRTLQLRLLVPGGLCPHWRVVVLLVLADRPLTSGRHSDRAVLVTMRVGTSHEAACATAYPARESSESSSCVAQRFASGGSSHTAVNTTTCCTADS